MVDGLYFHLEPLLGDHVVAGHVEVDLFALEGGLAGGDCPEIEVVANLGLHRPTRYFYQILIIVHLPVATQHVFEFELGRRRLIIRIASQIRVQVDRRLLNAFLAETVPVVPVLFVVPTLVAIRGRHLI